MAETVLTMLYDKLKESGYDVYFPSQHEGECITPYIVIKQSGVSPLLNVSSERPLYDIMLYVPDNEYSKLEGMILDIKVIMRDMYPMLMYEEGSQTPSFYEDTKKAHMVSVTYQGIRKIINMNI